MSKKEILVRNVTPEAEVSYNGLSVAFYDNPRTLIVEGKEIAQDRLYISINLIGKRDHIKRLATEDEPLRYKRAYDLYLAAKKAGGRLDETTKLIDSLAEKSSIIENKEKELSKKDAEIEELRKKLVIQQEAAKKTLKTE